MILSLTYYCLEKQLNYSFPYVFVILIHSLRYNASQMPAKCLPNASQMPALNQEKMAVTTIIPLMKREQLAIPFLAPLKAVHQRANHAITL